MSQPKRPRPVPPASSSRRAFLGSAAALAGSAALGGCAASGVGADRGAPVPKGAPRVPLGEGEPIRIGVIGTGGMGSAHLDGMLSARSAGREKLEIVAVCDVNAKRVEEARAKLREGAPDVAVEAYRHYPELLERDDVHAVLIASPEHWHAQMAEDAIAAGKDVYLEKPMTLRLPEALRLKQVVDANDAILQVGTQYMMIPKYAEARRLIQAGAIGVPTLSQTSYCRNSREGEWLYGIDPEVQPGEVLDWEAWLGLEHGLSKDIPFDTEIYHRWRRYRDFSTGIVGDLLPHQMTPMMWCLEAGWPVRVTAHGHHLVDKAMENHDQVFLTVSYENGHTMIVAGSTCNENGLAELIRGHEANLQLSGNNCVLSPESIFVDDVDPQTIECPGIDSQDALRLDWMRSIRTRGPNASPVEYGTRMMVICDLATRSMWDGKAWSFDPAGMTARALG
ncbi:MAG TPA: Gfo/Idh/MocA family oxidoreductase [Planctomycetota bacterium]|nr:Gfo/Idh/MocA family oxidoreductase [Planctomycetota bacterium]